MVALKKIWLHHPDYMGIPPSDVRQIKIPKKLQHNNLVKMCEVVSSKGAEGLDWEDKREDERRKKESIKHGGTTPLPLTNWDNVESARDGGHHRSGKPSSKLKEDRKKVVQASDTASRKKKKDSMSDLEKLRES